MSEDRSGIKFKLRSIYAAVERFKEAAKDCACFNNGECTHEWKEGRDFCQWDRCPWGK